MRVDTRGKLDYPSLPLIIKNYKYVTSIIGIVVVINLIAVGFAFGLTVVTTAVLFMLLGVFSSSYYWNAARAVSLSKVR